MKAAEMPGPGLDTVAIAEHPLLAVRTGQPVYYPDWISGIIAPEKFAPDRITGKLPEMSRLRVPLKTRRGICLVCAEKSVSEGPARQRSPRSNSSTQPDRRSVCQIA